MSEKQDLAILFSLLDKPTKDYIDSPSFCHLEQEIEVSRSSMANIPVGLHRSFNMK